MCGNARAAPHFSFAKHLAVTGTGQRVVISALASASTIPSEVPAAAAEGDSHVDGAHVITLGAGE